MDVLLEGAPVVEKVLQSSDSLRSKAAELLNYVKGEYEDDDGDRATGFILADPSPTNPPQCRDSSGIRDEVNRKMKGTDQSSSSGEASHSQAKAQTGKRSGMTFFSNKRHNNSWTRDTRPAEISGNEYSRKQTSESSSKGLQRSNSDIELRSTEDSYDAYVVSSDEDDLQRSNSDLELRSTEDVYVVSSDEDDPTFFCELCEETVALDSLFQMLNCACLFCRRCIKQNVECCLAEATQASERDSDNVVDTERDGVEFRTGHCSSGEKEKRILSEMQGFPRVSEPESVTDSLEWIPCPKASCTGRFPLSSSQILAPEAFRKWEEAANEAFFKGNAAFTKCPGCKVVIEKLVGVVPPGVALTGVPELDRTAPFTELDNEGQRLSRSAMCHKAANRFRCRSCSVDFCGVCLVTPYHLGKTCEEVEEEKNAIKCLYCEAPLRSSLRHTSDKELTLRSVKELQRELEREGVDAAWCVEKRDLVAVYQFVAGVCAAKECRKRALLSCTRSLECGHHCGGVRGERLCLPCLEDDCRLNTALPSGVHYLPAATDLCGICLVEPLRCAPSIQLQCGHVIHMHCAKQKLAQQFPGPEISFGYLNCPQCSEVMKHASLNFDMRKHLELKRLVCPLPACKLCRVREKALKRLTMEGLLKTTKELQPGGNFMGRPAAYAMQLYQYYICCKCQSPYFGGKRDCLANGIEGGNVGLNPSDLVCGGCSAAADGKGRCTKGHGKEYIEFKCRYCCSPASFFCFGRTHFCNSCHHTRPDNQQKYVPLKCKGPNWCPLRVSHLPNGQECCLGCSMCRFDGQ